MNKQKRNKKNSEQDNGVDDKIKPITKRLDTLIRLFIETNLNKNEKVTLTHFVKAMKSVGLDRQEIADILGKKPTDVDPLLYKKAKVTDTVSQENSEGGQNV